MFKLKDKVAIITGAGGGLGKSMAEALSKQGCKIAVFDIKKADYVKKLKTKSKLYEVDVSNEEQIKKAVDSVEKDLGKINILINNAGVFYPTPIKETEQEKWDKLIEVNVRGYFLMAKHVSKKMKKGKIINIASIAGHHAFAGSAAYNASKGAVIQLTKSLALDLAPNITANAICPGVFVTPMTKNLLKDKQMKQNIQNSVPLKRAGKSDEIGGLAVYLASDESSYMNGSIITIDGGWTCHL